MQNIGTKTIRTTIQLSKPKREITNIQIVKIIKKTFG